MATHKKYRNSKGEIVPGVTTITNRFKESGGLMFWANQVGSGEHPVCADQERCAQCGKREGKSHNAVAGAAADTGTYAHDLIDVWVTGVPMANNSDYDHLTVEQVEQAENCLDQFKRWYDSQGLTPLATELPLISDKHNFGGRIDFVARDKENRLVVPDWKTSNGIYADHLVQVGGGYTILLEENQDDLFGPVDEVHILRFSKEIASFEHRSWTRAAVQPAIDYFLQIRKAFDGAKAVKALLK